MLAVAIQVPVRAEPVAMEGQGPGAPLNASDAERHPEYVTGAVPVEDRAGEVPGATALARQLGISARPAPKPLHRAPRSSDALKALSMTLSVDA